MILCWISLFFSYPLVLYVRTFKPTANSDTTIDDTYLGALELFFLHKPISFTDTSHQYNKETTFDSLIIMYMYVQFQLSIVTNGKSVRVIVIRYSRYPCITLLTTEECKVNSDTQLLPI